MAQQLQSRMMGPSRKKKVLKAQSTLEYALFIACLVAAMVAMQGYLKRSFQGRFREQGDSIGRQYDPANTTSNVTLQVDSSASTYVTISEGSDQTIYTNTNTVTHYANQSLYGSEQVGGL